MLGLLRGERQQVGVGEGVGSGAQAQQRGGGGAASGGAQRLLPVRGVDDDDPRPGLVDEPGEFPGAGFRGQHHRAAADQVDREHHQRRFRAVGQEQPDAVARAEPLLAQRVSDLEEQSAGLSAGEPHRAVDDRVAFLVLLPLGENSL